MRIYREKDSIKKHFRILQHFSSISHHKLFFDHPVDFCLIHTKIAKICFVRKQREIVMEKFIFFQRTKHNLCKEKSIYRDI